MDDLNKRIEALKLEIRRAKYQIVQIEGLGECKTLCFGIWYKQEKVAVPEVLIDSMKQQIREYYEKRLAALIDMLAGLEGGKKND